MLTEWTSIIKLPLNKNCLFIDCTISCWITTSLISTILCQTIDTIKSIRKNIRLHEQIAIVAGACQSDYVGLIRAGSSFASSPNHINIHALDPAIVASEIALNDINSPLDVMSILSKTNCKEEGFGGLKIRGMMICGYPRKE